MHFHPGIRKLKALIDDGTLGVVLHAHAKIGTYITLVNSRSRHQAHQEGALFMDYTHQPDIFYWLLKQKPVSVYACGFQAGDMQFSSYPNVAVVTYEYDTPLVSSVHLNYVQIPERAEFEIVGDRGWAMMDACACKLKIGTKENSALRTEPFPYERDDVYRREHQAFFEAVSGKREPETSAADGLVSMALCDASIRSLKEREKVRVRYNM